MNQIGPIIGAFINTDGYIIQLDKTVIIIIMNTHRD